LAFITLSGAGMMLFIAGTNTFVQTNVADHLRGRVLSYYMMAFQGMQLLGSQLVGWLARHLGAPPTVLLQATAGLLVVALCWRSRPPSTVSSPPAAEVAPAYQGLARGTAAVNSAAVPLTIYFGVQRLRGHWLAQVGQHVAGHLG
jgi:MFS family permease